MADLQKIFTGMENGPETIQNNFDAVQQSIAANSAATQSTAVTGINESSIIDQAGVTSAAGYILRIGKVVYFSLYGVAGSPKAGTDTQSLYALPNGYKPAYFANQFSISWSQSASVNTQRAYVDGDMTVKWRMAAGNAYCSGSWVTNDDFPA